MMAPVTWSMATRTPQSSLSGCHTLRRVATVIVRRQKCCLSRASGVTVVVSEPSMVSVEFRLGRSWLFSSSGFLVASVCRTFEVV